MSHPACHSPDAIARAIRAFALSCSLACSAWIFLSSSLTNTIEICSSDSCVFSTIGLGWLNGLIPYRDVFDHKGPAIYLYNMLGYLFCGEFHGIAILELCSILAFASLFFTINTRRPLLYLAFLLFMLHYFYASNLEGGNYPEEYSIAFDAIAATVFFRRVRPRFWIYGLCGASAFLFRPNLAAFTFALFALDFLASPGKTKALCQTACGFLAPMAVVCAYFASHGALGDLFEQMIIFNIKYAGQKQNGFLETTFYFLQDSRHAWLAAFAMLAFLAVKDRRACAQALFFIFAPFLAYSMSGRLYDHYMLAMMPAFFLLFTLTFKNINALKTVSELLAGQKAWIRHGLAVVALAALALPAGLAWEAWAVNFNPENLKAMRQKLAALGLTDKSRVLNLTIHHNAAVFMAANALPAEKEFFPATARLGDALAPYLAPHMPICPPPEYDFVITREDQTVPENCGLEKMEDFPVPLRDAACWRKTAILQGMP